MYRHTPQSLNSRLAALSAPVARPAFSRLVCLGLLVAVFLMRPSIEGEVLNPVGVGLFAVLSLVQFLRAGKVRLSLNARSIALTSIVMFTFFNLHAVMNGAQTTFALRALIYVSTISIAGVLLMSVPENGFRLLDYLLIFMALMAASFCVTCALSFIFGLDRLVLFRLLTRSDTGAYLNTAFVYFPFTIGYDVRFYHGVQIPRLGGGWREAGIAQAMYCWALAYAFAASTLRGRLLVGLLFVGAAATQSTLAYMNVGIVVGILLLFVGRLTLKKLIITMPAAAAAIAGLVYFGINDENVGLASKLASTSYSDRTLAMERGVRSFLENPVGTGIFNSSTFGDGINLIASSGAIGLFGLLFIGLNWFASFFFTGFRVLKIASLVPLMATMIISQPLLDAPLFYFLILVDAGLYVRSSQLLGPNARSFPSIPRGDG